MPSRIKYHDIKDLKPEEVYNYLCTLEKPVVNDMRVKDVLNLDSLDKPLAGARFIDLSPRGVYMFFTPGGRVRYVGQTNKGFYDRILTQLDTTTYGHWGWNAMLRMMGGRRLNKPHIELEEADHEIDLEEVKKDSLLMIEVGSEQDMSAAKLKKLEKLMMKIYRSMEHRLPDYTLMNGQIGWLDDPLWENTIEQLLK